MRQHLDRDLAVQETAPAGEAQASPMVLEQAGAEATRRGLTDYRLQLLAELRPKLRGRGTPR